MKNFFLFLLSLTAVLGLSAADRDHSFVLGTSLGLLNGQAEEIVFRDGTTGDKLSQLLWEIKPLVYAGLDVRYNWHSPENEWGVFADALLKFGFPGETGVVEDRDWMDSRYSDFLTHYSVSDNKTAKAILADFNAGVSIRIFEQFLLKPFISYSYMNFSWTASGGSFLYPSFYGDHTYLLTASQIGSYTQEWYVFSIGASFYGAFNRYFDAEISLKLSPFALCMSEDNHTLRDLIITETMDGGFFIEPHLLFSFVPNKFLKLSLSAAYRNLSGSRGDSVYKINGQAAANIPKNIGGAGYSAVSVGLMAQFNIRDL